MDLTALEKEMSSIARCNPIYEIKLSELGKALVIARDQNEISSEEYTVLYQKYFLLPDSRFADLSLYKVFIQTDFIPCNFYLSSFLKTRCKLYEIYNGLKYQEISFADNFSALIHTINTEIQTKKESFWDSFLILLLCIYSGNPFVCDYTLEVLKILKYAAEVEGSLLDNISKQKMKVFSSIPEEVGKNNASRFHFIKALLTDRSSLDATLRGLCLNNKQESLALLLYKNHAEARISISADDAINICLCVDEIKDYLWIFAEQKSKMLANIEELLPYLNDDHLFNLVLRVILQYGTLDHRNIESLEDLNKLFELLDNFSVTYFGKEEFKKLWKERSGHNVI